VREPAHPHRGRREPAHDLLPQPDGRRPEPIAPDQAIIAILDVVKNFEMPGANLPGFQRKAVEMAVEGIYDLRSHKDEVVAPVLRFWNVAEMEGLSAEGEAARTELAEFMDALEKQALRFEDKRDMLKARMAPR